jgi:DNA-binding NarL/FixJ family response regulator
MQQPVILSSSRRPADSLALLVVDDYVAFAEALACRLDAEPGMSAVAVTDVEQVRQAIKDGRVDVILMDADLDGADGVWLAAELLTEYPRLRVVMVTVGQDEAQVLEAVRAGVSGWVPKDEPIEHLLAVVRGAMLGETWIPPRLLTWVLKGLKTTQGDRTDAQGHLAVLTRRERQVLALLAAGMSVDAIAAELYLSRNTVRTHIQNMLGKLKVHSALAAVAIARRAGLSPASSDQAAGGARLAAVRPKQAQSPRQ